jgi:hypothetical protein
MQQIEPIVWTTKQVATEIQVWNINDNLDSNCTFGWQLLTADGAYVDTGTIPCESVEYQNWDGNRQYPYQYTADTIGVILVTTVTDGGNN